MLIQVINVIKNGAVIKAKITPPTGPESQCQKWNHLVFLTITVGLVGTIGFDVCCIMLVR